MDSVPSPGYSRIYLDHHNGYFPILLQSHRWDTGPMTTLLNPL